GGWLRSIAESLAEPEDPRRRFAIAFFFDRICGGANVVGTGGKNAGAPGQPGTAHHDFKRIADTAPMVMRSMLFEELRLAADRAPVSRGDNHQLGRSGERRVVPGMRPATQGKQKKDTEDGDPLQTRLHWLSLLD